MLSFFLAQHTQTHTHKHDCREKSFFNKIRKKELVSTTTATTTSSSTTTTERSKTPLVERNWRGGRERGRISKIDREMRDSLLFWGGGGRPAGEKVTHSLVFFINTTYNVYIIINIQQRNYNKQQQQQQQQRRQLRICVSYFDVS
jgi:hypothetical protein